MPKAYLLEDQWQSDNAIGIVTGGHRIIAWVDKKERWLAQAIIDKLNEEPKTEVENENQAA